MKTNLFLKYITGESEFLPLELIPSKKLTAKESMDIYLNGYFARLTEVLGQHFEACWKILGDETFKDICAEYILNHPSSEWNINRYGRAFPSMIASNFAAEDYPFIADLASLEWSKQILFNKRDDIGLTAETQVTKENSRIKLVSSLEIGVSSYNIPAIFASTQSDENRFPENWEESTYWVMYKNDNQVHLYNIGQTSHQLLQSLMAGKPLNESLLQIESGKEAPETKTEEIQKLFQWLASNRLIQKIY